MSMNNFIKQAAPGSSPLGASVNPWSWKKHLGFGAASGLGLGGFMDFMQTPEGEYGNWDYDRVRRLIANTAIGAVAPALGKQYGIGTAISTAMLAPTKDVLFAAPGVMKAVSDASKKLSDKGPEKSTLGEDIKKALGPINWTTALLGLGALGLGGLAVHRYLTKKDDKTEMAKLKVRIPGKKDDPDSMSVVEVPISKAELSDTMVSGVERALKRRLRDTVKYNSTKEDPNTGKRISYEEYVNKYGDPEEQEVEKLINKSASMYEMSDEQFAHEMSESADELISKMADAWCKVATTPPPPCGE